MPRSVSAGSRPLGGSTMMEVRQAPSILKLALPISTKKAL